MKKTDVIISIDDFHEIDGEMQSASLSTVGELTVDGEGYSLTYSSIDESVPGETTLRFDERTNTVTMTRRGDGIAELVVEENRRYTGMYSTEFGPLALGVFGHSIHSHRIEADGSLNFRYTLDFNTGFSSKNELKVQFRRSGKDVGTCQK